jgi:hypothetical protein
VRVFLGLHEVAGYYAHLEQGLRRLGVRADFFQLSYHPFYSAVASPWFIRLAQDLNRRRGLARHDRMPSAFIWGVLSGVLRLLLFAWAAVRYDVFVFGYGSSFLPGFHDLPVLKALNRRVIFTFHGSDARPPYLDGTDMAPSRGLTVDGCIRLAERKKRRLRRMERWADVLISHPPYAQFNELPFVTCLSIGNPIQPIPEGERPQQREGGVRILHSPSFPEAKGTAEVRRVIERLRRRGLDIDYVEVSGVPNTVVLQELMQSDLVVDQVYSDAPLASFATEAAFMGRVAVIGGYVTPADLGVPEDRIPPCELCHPADLEATIARLIEDPAYREDSALRTRLWVTANWSPHRVAQRMLRVIQDDIPADWWYDPATITYVHGCCISEQRIRTLVRAIVARGGPVALQLDDKPGLRQQLLEWAVPAMEVPCSPAS